MSQQMRIPQGELENTVAWASLLPPVVLGRVVGYPDRKNMAAILGFLTYLASDC